MSHRLEGLCPLLSAMLPVAMEGFLYPFITPVAIICISSSSYGGRLRGGQLGNKPKRSGQCRRWPRPHTRKLPRGSVPCGVRGPCGRGKQWCPGQGRLFVTVYGPHVWGGAAPRRGVGFPQSGSGPHMCGGAGPGSGLSLPGARSGPWEQVGSSRTGQVPQEQVRSPESGSGPRVPSWLGPPEVGQPQGSHLLVLVVLLCGRRGGPDRPAGAGTGTRQGAQ